MRNEAGEQSSLKGAPTFGVRHRAFRAFWICCWWLLASWTPPPMHRWRTRLLSAFGADIHPSARVYSSCRIWDPRNLSMAAHSVLGPEVHCYSMARISLGEMAVISQRSTLCAGTHDISDVDFRLVTRPISIHRNAWVAAEAFIAPGVTVGEHAVVGARALLARDAEPFGVYVGNPARRIKSREYRAREGTPERS